MEFLITCLEIKKILYQLQSTKCVSVSKRSRCYWKNANSTLRDNTMNQSMANPASLALQTSPTTNLPQAFQKYQRSKSKHSSRTRCIMHIIWVIVLMQPHLIHYSTIAHQAYRMSLANGGKLPWNCLAEEMSSLVNDKALLRDLAYVFCKFGFHHNHYHHPLDFHC